MTPTEFTRRLRACERRIRVEPITAREWVAILAGLARVERPPGPLVFVAIDVTRGGFLILDEYRKPMPDGRDLRRPACR